MTSDPDPSTHEFPAVERRGHGSGLYDSERHPRQRRADNGWRYWCPWLYRNTLPLAAVVAAFLAFARTQSDVDRQKEGRAITIDVLCGFSNGVSEAGIKALAGKLNGQRGQGLPIEAQRDYVDTITSPIFAEAGIKARTIVEPDGTIDCPKLRVAGKAP